MSDDRSPGGSWQAEEPVEVSDLVRRRQRGGARVMALVLGALVLLIFLITIAKIRHGG